MDLPSTLTPGDGQFPAAVTRLADAPASLRLRGSLGTPARRVALVGARRSDRYGRDTARRLARGLARAGVSVVSGGALGVDAEAHEGALEAGGHTVAVLGCGVDLVAPPSHRDLFDRILRGGGALLSEYPDGAPAAPWRFPHRNRLVAALCDAVVVVRAGPRSGALITATRARELGVPLMAVPGDADQELSVGPLGLLRAGARLAADVEDVLALLGLAPGAQPALPGLGAAVAVDEEGRAVLGALATAPRHVGEVARAAGLPAGRTLAALLTLELEGLAEQRPGQYFQRRAA